MGEELPSVSLFKVAKFYAENPDGYLSDYNSERVYAPLWLVRK
jgi:hypothetical protein